MLYHEGTCDWCNKQSVLFRHQYIDGKFNHSCESCHEIAVADVRQLNRELEEESSKFGLLFQQA